MRRLLLSSLAAGSFLAMFASSAGGAAFYNDSSSPNPMEVYFYCGTSCHNDWEIKSHDNAGRYGADGKFWLLNVGGFTGQDGEACQYDTHSVSSHGWGSLHDEGGYTWAIYNNSGDPVSGSPFALVFREYKDPIYTTDTSGCGG